MRKQDIKPGVVYAYQRGEYGPLKPCVVLSLEMHKTVRGAPGWTRAEGHDRPQRGDLVRPAIGYPVVMGEPELAGGMASLGAGIIASGLTDEQVCSGLSGNTLYAPVCLRGPYAEVAAALAERERAELEANARARAARNAELARAITLTDELGRSGIAADSLVVDGTRHITLTLDEAEKLARLLAEQAGTEGSE